MSVKEDFKTYYRLMRQGDIATQSERWELLKKIGPHIEWGVSQALMEGAGYPVDVFNQPLVSKGLLHISGPQYMANSDKWSRYAHAYKDKDVLIDWLNATYDHQCCSGTGGFSLFEDDVLQENNKYAVANDIHNIRQRHKKRLEAIRRYKAPPLKVTGRAYVV